LKEEVMPSMKERLQQQYGSLRKCAVETGINYYRISQMVNGYVKPKPAEVKALAIKDSELKALNIKAGK
jgi:hypothetical protein